MDNNMILDYWSNPFRFVKFGLGEDEVFNDPNPIVFMGGRGTGKTMFLRYCCYDVQNSLPISSNTNVRDNRAGFYIRIDGPILRSFEGFGVPEDTWGAIFTHFFELFICKAYFVFFQDLQKKGSAKAEGFGAAFFERCSNLLCNDSLKFDNINDIIEYLDDLLKEVNMYRAQIPLKNVDFSPALVFPSQYLTFGIPEIFKQSVLDGNKFQFILMIDEYENFLQSQQRVINTLIKFVKPGITFRLGMRLEGFRTYDTISKDDFIKEGRDYKNIVFEEVLIKDSGYSNYLKDIANKRLRKIPCFEENNLTDITDFLGDRENLEEEAKEIVNNKGDKIFDHYGIEKKDRNLLKCVENPLLQVLNCLWLKRGKTPKEINKTMNDYLAGIKTPEVIKYRMDYVDKYKLSLMFIVATIYKKDKKYYSFNTFSYLSSGIVGHFIELCRRCFQYAEFEDKSNLISNGDISKHLQNSAARDLAESELQQVRRIEKYGNKLYVFTQNLGETFRKYHKDIHIRYPETNQFSVDKTLLNEPIKDAFEAAQRWSIIQRKPKTQQQSIGKKKNDIFTLNRIFAPIFQFSYRTRGGFSEEYNSVQISSLMEKEHVEFRLEKNKVKQIVKDSNQPELGF